MPAAAGLLGLDQVGMHFRPAAAARMEDLDFPGKFIRSPGPNL